MTDRSDIARRGEGDYRTARALPPCIPVEAIAARRAEMDARPADWLAVSKADRALGNAADTGSMRGLHNGEVMQRFHGEAPGVNPKPFIFAAAAVVAVVAAVVGWLA